MSATQNRIRKFFKTKLKADLTPSLRIEIIVCQCNDFTPAPFGGKGSKEEEFLFRKIVC